MLQLVLESGLMAVLDVYCASWLVIRLFHLTSFVWMFLEGESLDIRASYICMCISLPLSGLYLFLQVQFPLSLTSVRYRHFTLIGWGKYSPGENGKNRAETNMNISDQYCLWEGTLRAMLTRLISVTVTNPPIQRPTRWLLSIFRTMLTNCNGGSFVLATMWLQYFLEKSMENMNMDTDRQTWKYTDCSSIFVKITLKFKLLFVRDSSGEHLRVGGAEVPHPLPRPPRARGGAGGGGERGGEDGHQPDLKLPLLRGGRHRPLRLQPPRLHPPRLQRLLPRLDHDRKILTIRCAKGLARQICSSVLKLRNQGEQSY